jgi:predicted nucleic acid binding AN1-type Zn finger protein
MVRCEKCRKKLVIEYKCKCEKIFCITHLHAEEHDCTFDYKEKAHAELKKKYEIGPLVNKVDKI